MKLDAVWFEQTRCFIDGRWCAPLGGEYLAVENPSDGCEIGQIARGQAADIDQAVAAATAARAGEWGRLPAFERGRLLARMGQLVLKYQDALTEIEAADVGKPATQARNDALALARYLEFYGGAADKVMGETIPYLDGYTVYTLREPHGVTGHIVPWNYPMQIIGRSVGAALAMGNACVLKPAEEACLTALAFAAIAEEAGLPKGALNVVPGLGSEAGAALSAHSGVQHISFTGSVPVGALIQGAAAKNVVPVTLELGGKSPQLVFDDADLDKAVEGAMISKFRNNGQTCVCANRIYVQDAVYDAFAEKLAVAVKKLKVGDGFDAGVTEGPLINQSAIEKVKMHVADAVSKGAVVVTGGHEHALGGTFFEPTVLTGVTSDMMVTNDETFGPVAPLFRFADEEDVIAQANDTIFGLASYFYARDLSRVYRVSEALEYGMVGINTGLISTEVAPFGGVKQSGQGREGSRHGVEDYLEMKYICIALD